MKKLFFLLVSWVFLLGASFGCFAEEKECRGVVTSQQVFDCSVKKKSLSDKRLNEEYRELKRRIYESYGSAEKERDSFWQHVKEAQREWIDFRDATCRMEASGAEKSSQAYEALSNNCVARLTDERTLYLNGFAR